ncbi:glycosyltransferase family 4 protein [Sphingosinicella sp. CPCC 101087]|uniref:glycosyltransferase family 4 protein n=1 Tax=Sphingosinicella sp. CPCC 101087 TaxID=2497754 RepID=UPI00101BCD7A|nr:glycosyltransferase family 4 protein [Sphingosinicella sp. CPCC 101087]
MRLLFAIKSLALAGGGAERVASEVAGMLARRGNAVMMLTFDRLGYPPFYPLDPAIERIALGIGDVARRTGKAEALRRIGAMRRAALRARPDVAIGFMHSTYIPLGISLLGTGLPLVASEHISYDHYRGRPLQAGLLRLAPWLAQTITVLSEAVQAGFPAALRRSMTVVPNPVALPGARADVAGSERGPRILLAVGRLEPQKDHAILVEAFARIAGDFPDWRLRIVGEGALRPALEAQVLRLGLEAKVELPGAVADIGREYAAAQLFAMPSAYESFGLTTAEALGHGLPVVGFADCPGTNELVRGGVNGLLAAGQDRTTALAEALSRLMASPRLRQELGARGPASLEPFAPEKIADLWEALLSRIAAGDRRGRGG